MLIAIHHTAGSFSDKWIEYCNKNAVPYKLVNCYHNDIIQQLDDCVALMWHFHHASPKDFLFAKQLLFSVQFAGKKVFPDFNSMWHFDDKVGQKYLLESIGAPLVNSFVFYSKNEALEWCSNTNYPKVFKLRSGAGSANVQLIKSSAEATAIIHKAFGKGFKNDSLVPLSDLYNKYRHGRVSAKMLFRGLLRTFIPTPFAKVNGREKGYVYFQDFVPDNVFDIRIIVIGDKAFGIKRMARENDFRASGSGNILYERENFDEQTIQLAFDISKKLKSQCVAFDFIYVDNTPLLIEVSYGFNVQVYEPCTGYWDEQLNWYPGAFNPYGWMVEQVLQHCRVV